jgi:hypothetical protein
MTTGTPTQFDISGLQLRDLAPEERVDYTKGYELAGEYQVPPPEGQYILQVSELKPAKHKEGILAADLTAVVAENNPKGAGYKVFENGGIFNIKKNKFRNASNIDDFLRAFGITFSTPPSVAEYAQALSATFGRFGPAVLKWEGYCKDCDANIKGADSFPLNPDGTRNYRRPCPTCKKDVFARAKIARWVSTVPEDQTSA